jgi:hypothetical protein
VENNAPTEIVVVSRHPLEDSGVVFVKEFLANGIPASYIKK